MSKKVRHIILLICLSTLITGFAQQDSIAEAYIAQKNMEDLRDEQKELNFQKFFFDALHQRAIGNFDIAVNNLESCQNIKIDDKAVQFEFGKNYFDLEKYIEAAEYTRKALEKDPGNLFILLLLKNIYNKQNLFKDAIDIQKKIVLLDENEQLGLVLLFIKNNQIEEAKQLLRDLEKKGTLDANLIPFKESLLKGTVLNADQENTIKSLEDQSIEELREAFKKNKDFKVLKSLLAKLNNKKKFIDLEKDSREAIELFPAQPLVYLMHGGALNQMKSYQPGLETLLLGLDYLIDDPKLEAEFYEQISLSYKGLGQNSMASKFYNKAVALRQNKL